MTLIAVALLGYALIGALLIAWTMRSADARFSLTDWIVMIFLWPFFLGLFFELERIQARARALKDWARRKEDENR